MNNKYMYVLNEDIKDLIVLNGNPDIPNKVFIPAGSKCTIIEDLDEYVTISIEGFPFTVVTDRGNVDEL